MAARTNSGIAVAAVVFGNLLSACTSDAAPSWPTAERLLETGQYGVFGCSTFTTWYEDGSIVRETMGRDSCHDVAMGQLDNEDAEQLTLLVHSYDASGYDPAATLSCSDGLDDGYAGWTIFRSLEPERIHLCDSDLDPNSELGSLARRLKEQAQANLVVE